MNYTKSTLLLPVAASLMVFAGVAFSYQPPIGIPDPAWGSLHPVDTKAPSHPAAWPSAGASNFYYIDSTHPSATDSGNPNGYPDKPRRTMPNKVYGPGTYMELHGSFKKLMPAQQMRFNCTEAAPCWIRGVQGSEPVIEQGLELVDSSYVFVENLKFTGGQSVGFIGHATPGKTLHHVVFRNSEVSDRDFPGSATAGASFYPKDGAKIHDVVIYKNRFTDLGTNVTWETGDPDFHAIAPNVYGRDAKAGTELKNMWVLDNYCTRIAGNCVQIIGQNCKNGNCLDVIHHIYIGRNEAHANRQAGFWSKQARDVIFSQNTSYDNRSHAAQPGDGMGFQYAPHNIWFLYNTIHDCNYGIRQSSTHEGAGRNAYFIGNVIYDIHPQPGNTSNPRDDWRQGVGISLWQGEMNRYIVNNTIDDVNAGVVAIQSGPLVIEGNIIGNIADNDFHMSIAHPARHGVASVNNSLLYDKDVGTRIRWNWADYTSMSAFQRSTSQCAKCVAESPEFENAIDRKFSLKRSSPVIGKLSAKADDVYTVYQARYGENIRVDINRVDRGTTMDMGAYEYAAGSKLSPPVKPRGLRVNTLKR